MAAAQPQRGGARRPAQSTGGRGCVVSDRVRPLLTGRKDKEAGTGRALVLVTKMGFRVKVSS